MAPGQEASRHASSWLWAATRWPTSSSRARTTARRARVSSLKGCKTRSRWARRRRYSAISSASPGSDLAPDRTSPSRHALIAFGCTGATGWPASNSASTSRPSGRSIATGTLTAAPSSANRLVSRSMPSRLWATVNERTLMPPGSSTHTACSSLAQSMPTNTTGFSDATTFPTDGSPFCGPMIELSMRRVLAGRSLTGALRRFPLLPVRDTQESGGRRCHAGPQRATTPGRHPHPHRDLSSTLTRLMTGMVDQ